MGANNRSSSSSGSEKGERTKARFAVPVIDSRELQTKTSLVFGRCKHHSSSEIFSLVEFDKEEEVAMAARDW